MAKKTLEIGVPRQRISAPPRQQVAELSSISKNVIAKPKVVEEVQEKKSEAGKGKLVRMSLTIPPSELEDFHALMERVRSDLYDGMPMSRIIRAGLKALNQMPSQEIRELVSN